jgi:hypothetical protein
MVLLEYLLGLSSVERNIVSKIPSTKYEINYGFMVVSFPRNFPLSIEKV